MNEPLQFIPDVFVCPKHGEHQAIMHISIPKLSIENDYCCVCMAEKFDDIGILRMTKQPGDGE